MAKQRKQGPRTLQQHLAAEKRAMNRITQAMARTKVSKRGNSRRPSASKAVRAAIDGPAAAWMKLLTDPCYGVVTHPIYPGSDGGLLARFENEFTVGAGVTETGSLIGFIPGGLSNSLYLNNTPLTLDTTPTLMTATFSPNSPGYAYLQANASAIRCVSACLQASWPGSELNRQGFVALGQCSAALLTEAASTTTSVAQVRPLAHLRTRMPESFAEVVWRPTLGDAEWTDPSVSTPPNDLNKKGAVFAAVSNLPTGTGVRFRLIVTYEYQPKVNLGLGSAFDNRAMSRNTLDDVINALDRNGPSWAFRVGRVTSALAGMTGAYMVGSNRHIEL